MKLYHVVMICLLVVLSQVQAGNHFYESNADALRFQARTTSTIKKDYSSAICPSMAKTSAEKSELYYYIRCDNMLYFEGILMRLSEYCQVSCPPTPPSNERIYLKDQYWWCPEYIKEVMMKEQSCNHCGLTIVHLDFTYSTKVSLTHSCPESCRKIEADNPEQQYQKDQDKRCSRWVNGMDLDCSRMYKIKYTLEEKLNDDRLRNDIDEIGTWRTLGHYCPESCKEAEPAAWIDRLINMKPHCVGFNNLTIIGFNTCIEFTFLTPEDEPNFVVNALMTPFEKTVRDTPMKWFQGDFKLPTGSIVHVKITTDMASIMLSNGPTIATYNINKNSGAIQKMQNEQIEEFMNEVSGAGPMSEISLMELSSDLFANLIFA